MIARLSETPGKIRHTGPALGQHSDDVFGGELGLSADELAELRRQGVI